MPPGSNEKAFPPDPILGKLSGGMGESHPWPDALQAPADPRQTDASALRGHSAPLGKRFDEQDLGKPARG